MDTDVLTASPAAHADAPEVRLAIEVAGRTHTGLVRRRNEDHFYIARAARTLDMVCSNIPPDLIPAATRDEAFGYIVADGIGGGRSGDVASRRAIQTLVDLCLKTPDWIFKPEPRLIPELLRRQEARFHAIRDAFAEQAEADPELDGMGTTLTLVLTAGLHLVVAHVGDSRAYILRDGALIRLTRDQTVAQALADSGWISQARVDTHPDRHVLLQAIDTEGGEMEVDVGHVMLHPGDTLLLSTDGLTNMVPERRIAAVLAERESPSEAVEELVRLALEAGGSDNVTVLVGRYAPAPA